MAQPSWVRRSVMAKYDVSWKRSAAIGERHEDRVLRRRVDRAGNEDDLQRLRRISAGRRRRLLRRLLGNGAGVVPALVTRRSMPVRKIRLNAPGDMGGDDGKLPDFFLHMLTWERRASRHSDSRQLAGSEASWPVEYTSTVSIRDRRTKKGSSGTAITKSRPQLESPLAAMQVWRVRCFSPW